MLLFFYGATDEKEKAIIQEVVVQG